MKQLDFFEQNKQTWLNLAKEFANKYGREHGGVSADEIHKALPIPNWIDGRIMGSVFKGMRFVRFKKSERKECHHRIIGVFAPEETIERKSA